MSSKNITTNLYNNTIAQNYDLDRFNLLSDTHQIALNQIEQNSRSQDINSILDLALGTGAILTKLKPIFPQAKLMGIDLSSEMIAVAQQKLDVVAFNDSAENISKYVSYDRTDLILVHFLLAYVNPQIIIAEAAKLLSSGGLLSIATSTYQSFPKLQSLASKFLTPEELNLAQVPQDADALASLLDSVGLEIVRTEVLNKKVNFSTFDEAYHWGKDSGWFTQYLVNLSPEKIAAISAIPDLFPFEDKFQSTIILSRKK